MTAGSGAAEKGSPGMVAEKMRSDPVIDRKNEK
jgi:hypothetical protein